MPGLFFDTMAFRKPPLQETLDRLREMQKTQEEQYKSLYDIAYHLLVSRKYGKTPGDLLLTQAEYVVKSYREDTKKEGVPLDEFYDALKARLENLAQSLDVGRGEHSR